MTANFDAARRRFDTVIQFALLFNRGVSIEATGNELRLSPKGLVTSFDDQWATANKAELLELLGWLACDTWRDAQREGALPARLPAEPAQWTKRTLEAEFDAGGCTPRSAAVQLLALARESGEFGGGE